MAEEKIRADPHFGDMQPVDQHRPHERLGIPLRELRREPHNRDALAARLLERFELLRLRHEQRRGLVGPDDARRMRVEGHDDGGGDVFDGDPAQALEDFAMAAVQPVEVAEREHRAAPPRRPRIVWKVNDVHELSIDLDHQTIIGQLHAARQLRAGVGVPEIVRDVCEVRAGRAEA